jgi:hypothetical protein
MVLKFYISLAYFKLEVLKAGDKIAETYAFEPDISYDTTTYKK